MRHKRIKIENDVDSEPKVIRNDSRILQNQNNKRACKKEGKRLFEEFENIKMDLSDLLLDFFKKKLDEN